MKFFKYFVISFFSFIALIIIASFFLPNSIDSELTQTIKVKKKHLYKYLSDIENLHDWSMWGSYNDSTLTFSTEISSQNNLHVYRWKAEILGEGSITITSIKPDTLEFLTSVYDDEFEMYGFIALKQLGDETVIYRRQTIDLGSNPVYKVVGFLMQEYITTDLENELQRIKEIAEAMKPLEHNIKIIYDNSAQGDKYKYGWGFSCLVNDSILFDTGENFEKLHYNIKEMGIDLSKILKLIISHDHWDHTGGIKELLPLLPNLKQVFFPQNINKDLLALSSEKAQIGNASYHHLSDYIILTKNFETRYDGKQLYEQSLLLKSEDNSFTILAGCAHPGIDRMVRQAKSDLNIEIKTVMGGFHLTHSKEEDIQIITQNLRELGVTRVAPTHCSGKKAKEIFKGEFPGQFINVFTGKEVEID